MVFPLILRVNIAIIQNIQNCFINGFQKCDFPGLNLFLYTNLYNFVDLYFSILNLYSFRGPSGIVNLTNIYTSIYILGCRDSGHSVPIHVIHQARTPKSSPNPCHKMFRKWLGQKPIIFYNFSDFWALRREFGTIFGPKTGPRGPCWRDFWVQNSFLHSEVIFSLFFGEIYKNAKNKKVAFVS